MPTDTEMDTDKDMDIRLILSTNANSHTHYVLHDNTLHKQVIIKGKTYEITSKSNLQMLQLRWHQNAAQDLA